MVVAPDAAPYSNGYIRVSKLSYLLSGEAYTDKLDFDSRCDYTYVEPGTYYYYAAPVLFTHNTDMHISGKFLQTEVVGDPASILQIEALKNGWLGSWNPNIPAGAYQKYPFTRKNVSSTYSRAYTSDAGLSWGYAPGPTFDVLSNSYTNTHATGLVLVNTYQAFAKQTKPSTNLPILHGEKGLGSVIAASGGFIPQGGLLGETLIGKVTKSQYTSTAIEYVPLLRKGIVNDSLSALTSGLLKTTHAPLSGLLGTANETKAVKFLDYQIGRHNQASLGFQANELTYATSWGDDGTIKVTNGTTTFTDDNGNTNIMTSHELAIPYGWIKNDK